MMRCLQCDQQWEVGEVSETAMIEDYDENTDIGIWPEPEHEDKPTPLPRTGDRLVDIRARCEAATAI